VGIRDLGAGTTADRILIVDDDPSNVAMLEVFLAEESSSIRTLTDSKQVERVFTEFEPDILLLDLHMPPPDGLEILRNLRGARTALGFLPVIVLTGDTGRTARNSALVLGADDFLTKPLDRQEVVLRVRNLLRTRRLYAELANANEALEKNKAKPPASAG
jgi:putative two-component system response regulator